MSWHPPETSHPNYPEYDQSLHVLKTQGRLILGTRAPLYAQSMAQKIFNDLGEEYVYISFWDCRNENDGLLCLLHAVSLPTRSSLVDVSNRLVEIKVSSLICVGITNRCLPIIETLLSLSPKLSCILIGDTNIHKTIDTAVEIDRFEDPQSLFSDDELLRTAEALLAYLPAGLDLPHEMDPKLAFPSPKGWLQLHPNLSSYLRERLDPEPLLEVLARHLEPQLNMASGAPLPNNTHVQHLFALRWLAETTTKEALSLQATLAQARIMLCWSQRDQAKNILESAIARAPKLPARSIGLIYTTIAECLLYSGQHRASQQYFNRAIDHAMRSEDNSAIVFILRRQAEMSLSFGLLDQSESILKKALSRSAHHNLESERMAILRALASIAILRDDNEKAAQLLEQTLSSQSRSIEEANRRLTQSELAFIEGKSERAHRLLAESERFDMVTPHIMANRFHRRAFFLFEAQLYDQAIESSNHAIRLFENCGELIGLASLYGLLGLIHGHKNEPETALTYFRRAMVLQIQIHDMNGLKSSLQKTLDLLQSSTPSQHRFLNEIYAELESSEAE